MDNLIWQPGRLHDQGYDFMVYLDRSFAEKALSFKIQKSVQQRMNELCTETCRQFGFNPPGPLFFEENSCLVNRFDICSDGAWLSTDYNSSSPILNPADKIHVEYHTHNVNISSKAYCLMALFNRWVDLSNTIIK